MIVNQPINLFSRKGLLSRGNIMTEDEVECPYCGEVFHSDEEEDATTKEGIHRANEHVNNSPSEESSKSKSGSNIIRKWKTEGKRA
jgi:uncharacterized Zn finger protein (UPF0148 family)